MFGDVATILYKMQPCAPYDETRSRMLEELASEKFAFLLFPDIDMDFCSGSERWFINSVSNRLPSFLNRRKVFLFSKVILSNGNDYRG